MNPWDLLPPALVTRAKAVAALLGAVAEVAVSFDPPLAANHYAAAAIAVLTFLGVYAVPSRNVRSRIAEIKKRDPRYSPTAAIDLRDPQ